LYKDNKSEAEYFSTKKVSLRDVCGAGDTFLAGLVVKYIETNDIKKSIIYANECASIVVSKFGVVVP
jgi:sugar/nucleoside kinase (ribokinase family)